MVKKLHPSPQASVPEPSAAPSTVPGKVRKRTVCVCFWLSPAEAAAFAEAETAVAQRSGKERQRGEHLRDMVKQFVRDVRMSNEFTE